MDNFSNRWNRSHSSVSHSCKCHIWSGFRVSSTSGHNESQSLSRLWTRTGFDREPDRSVCRDTAVGRCITCWCSVDRSYCKHERDLLDRSPARDRDEMETNECNQSRWDIAEDWMATYGLRPMARQSEDIQRISRNALDRWSLFDWAIRTRKLENDTIRWTRWKKETCLTFCLDADRRFVGHIARGNDEYPQWQGSISHHVVSSGRHSHVRLTVNFVVD